MTLSRNSKAKLIQNTTKYLVKVSVFAIAFVVVMVTLTLMARGVTSYPEFKSEYESFCTTIGVQKQKRKYVRVSRRDKYAQDFRETLYLVIASIMIALQILRLRKGK